MSASSESSYGNVSIGTTAAIVRAARGRRESIIVKNNHATQILYLGSNADVATTTGLPLAAGDSIRLQTKSDVYGIASGAATDVRYFEEF